MRRLLTPTWLLCHALAAALIVAMLGMAGWQFSRATGGNGLSWGYTLQWPVFAGFVGFIWWREVQRTLRAGRDQPEDAVRSVTPARRPVITRRVSAVPDEADPDLAAYNSYLAWLNANPGARPADYPGRM